MQRDQQFHSKEALPPLANQVANNYMHFPIPSSFASFRPPPEKHLTPVHGIDFQPSEVCPKNFIIFDQTDHHSQIMYNPAIAHKFSGPCLNIHPGYMAENFDRKNVNNVERETSSLKEDSDDIDALLSLDEEEEEEEEEEEYDEEELSTARTHGNYEGNSPDSYSSYGSNPRKNGSSTQKFSASVSGCSSERKRQRMKKMVKTLRGIVPGGDQMNTVTVLDEAVSYLKSLKVEVQKLGVANFKN